MQIIKKNIIKITILILILLSISALYLKYNLYKHEKENIEEEVTENVKKEQEVKNENIKKINIDIKGAIQNPGVYEVEENSKVIDAVKISGGLTTEADTTYINLAKKLKDEMVIVIYTKNQIEEAKKKQTQSIINDTTKSCICPKISNDACINQKETVTSNEKNTIAETTTILESNKDETSKKVNINTAGKEELQTLSGIGEGKAEAIMKYREENGNFKVIEDITKVSGIGEAVYEKIKDNITV